MKRKQITIFGAVLAALLGAAGVMAYHFAGASDNNTVVKNDTGSATPNFPPAFPPALPASAAPTAPAAGQAETPATPPAPPQPSPMPAPIAKALAAARADAPSRPMTRLAKDWFGCASEDGYTAMLAMIKQKSPGTGDHFHGSDADCTALSAGTHISVLRVNSASGIAQVSLDETHKVVWTDTETLAGEASNGGK